MSGIKGKIPKEIIYVCRKESTLNTKSITINNICEAFPIEVDNNIILYKAIDWARLKPFDQKFDPPQVKITNKPSKIKIVDIEKRSMGGRAWKVLVDDKYLVDLREEQLFDGILLDGIEKEGTLNGEWAWVKFSNELKLVNIKSDDYISSEPEIAKSTDGQINYKNIEKSCVYSMEKDKDHFYVFVDFTTKNSVLNLFVDPFTSIKDTGNSGLNIIFNQIKDDDVCLCDITNLKLKTGMILKIKKTEPLENLENINFDNVEFILKSNINFDKKEDFKINQTLKVEKIIKDRKKYIASKLSNKLLNSFQTYKEEFLRLGILRKNKWVKQ